MKSKNSSCNKSDPQESGSDEEEKEYMQLIKKDGFGH